MPGYFIRMNRSLKCNVRAGDVRIFSQALCARPLLLLRAFYLSLTLFLSSSHSQHMQHCMHHTHDLSFLSVAGSLQQYSLRKLSILLLLLSFWKDSNTHTHTLKQAANVAFSMPARYEHTLMRKKAIYSRQFDALLYAIYTIVKDRQINGHRNETQHNSRR